MSKNTRQKKTVYFTAVPGREYEKLAPQAVSIMETIKGEGKLERQALIGKLKVTLKQYKQSASRLLSYYKASLVKSRYLKIEVEVQAAPEKPAKAAKAPKAAKPTKVAKAAKPVKAAKAAKPAHAVPPAEVAAPPAELPAATAVPVMPSAENSPVVTASVASQVPAVPA